MLAGYGAAASRRKHGGAGDDDDGPLRPLWESEGGKKGNVALGGLSVMCRGFIWRAQARRGLRGQTTSDAWRTRGGDTLKTVGSL